MEGDIDLGPLGEKAWWEVDLPPCPDCGGDIAWFEAGYAPRTRKCLGKPIKVEVIKTETTGEVSLPMYNKNGGCGAMYRIDVRNKHAFLHRLEVKDGILQ